MKISITSFIYRKVIDPILSKIQRSIINMVGPEDKVLDIACGTGSLSLTLSSKCKEVTGIDLSEEMIDLAIMSAIKQDRSNVNFFLKDATDLSEFKSGEFDFAITSLSIHQFDSSLAIEILREMKRISSRVLIMDYFYPIQTGFWRKIIYTVEWIAGGEHFRNFRNYNRLGGLDYFLLQAGLVPQEPDLYRNGTFRVVLASPG